MLSARLDTSKIPSLSQILSAGEYPRVILSCIEEDSFTCGLDDPVELTVAVDVNESSGKEISLIKAKVVRVNIKET